MRKLRVVAVSMFTIGIACAPDARAQQSPGAAPATKQAPATQSPKKPAAPAAQKPGTAAQKPAARSQTPLALKTQKDKVSYAIGLNIGKSMKHDSADIDPNILARGIKDALAGAKPLLTDEEAQAAVAELRTELKAKQEERMKALSDQNQKEGVAFLAANKTKEGVVALPSGLQYKILKEGTGPKPVAADTVVCNYRGTLLDNKEFDSSDKHGGPATFTVGQVIKGWTEALQLMPVGSKWELYIPGELAYGSRGAGPDIGPNATLIFDVELVSIQQKTPAPEKSPPADKPAAPEAPKPQ